MKELLRKSEIKMIQERILYTITEIGLEQIFHKDHVLSIKDICLKDM